MFVSASTLAQAQADEPPKRPGWTPGPVTGQLGSRGKVNVAEGEIFLDAPATRTFLEEGQNIPDGDELGAVLHVNRDDSYWFAIFSYDDSGHVDDSDRKGLEAGAIMEDMIEGNRQGNEERRRRGWTELTLEGWYREPYYDQATNNLTWSTRIASPEGRGINHSVRLLGRTGVMSVALVADADESLDRSVSEFDKMLTGVSYVEGQRYAEFKPGDKVAAYGLAGLIGAGAAGVALKTGLFQKFWKLIVLAVLALVGVIKKVFSKITGRRDAVQAPEADPRSGRF
jgi:uncharacterized membrane-anchored protein